jgi:hypothetical protein
VLAGRVDLTFRLEPEDYLALSRHISRTLVERLISIPYWIGVGAFGMALGLAFHSWVWVGALGFEWDRLEQRVFVATGALAIGVLFFEVVMKSYTRAIIGASQHVGEVRLTADASGFTEQCGAFTLAAPWSAIVRVQQTPEHLFFFTTRRQAVVVPRSNLNKESEANLVAWANAAESRVL